MDPCVLNFVHAHSVFIQTQADCRLRAQREMLRVRVTEWLMNTSLRRLESLMFWSWRNETGKIVSVNVELDSSGHENVNFS